MSTSVGFRQVHFQILEVRNVRKGLVSQDVYVRTRLVPLMVGVDERPENRKDKKRSETVRLDVVTEKKTNQGQDLAFHQGFSFTLPVFHLMFDLWKTRALKEDKLIGTFTVSLEEVARSPNMCYSGWHETRYPPGTKRAGEPSGKVFVAIQLDAPSNTTTSQPSTLPGQVLSAPCSASAANHMVSPLSSKLYPSLDEPPKDQSYVECGGEVFTSERQPQPFHGLYPSYENGGAPTFLQEPMEYYPSTNPYLIATAPPVENG
eukprot:jgi/Galph1/2428/GphlegSOOS_G1095.1